MMLYQQPAVLPYAHPSNDMAENITPAGRKQSNPMQDERQAMDKYQGYIAQIREEQAMRMENLKKYFPFFQIADNSLEQFQNGKYSRIDMGYTLMAILRMFIEENNFNDTGVSYRDYHAFLESFLAKEFGLRLDREESAQIAAYIFDKIKNDGKPFTYTYYDPEIKKEKAARVWLIKSNFFEGSIYYYITETGIEFYLNTKEFKEESKISIQQLLLEKMIKSRNFRGGREVVRRICNEVNKLKMEKRSVLNVLSHDLKEGIRLYDEFFQNSVRWFDEEHDLFMKNAALIGGAMNMLSPLEQVKNREEIFLLDGELKTAIARHSELLAECMDLKKKADAFVEQGKLNSIRSVFYFKQYMELLMDRDSSSGLENLVSPLLLPHVKKIFDLNRIDDLFLLHPGLEEETEELKEAREADYVYDDELEEARISGNFSRLLKLLFEMFKKEGEFELKDWNRYLEERFGKRIFVNGDYYSFLVQLCQKQEYHIKQAAEKPSTAFEGLLAAYYLEQSGTGDMTDFRLTMLPEDELELPSAFTVTNIRFEKAP